MRLVLFDSYSKQCFNQCTTLRSMSLLEMTNAAAYKYYRRQEYQDLYNSSVAIMLRDMQREVKTGRPSESRLHIDFSQ